MSDCRRWRKWEWGAALGLFSILMARNCAYGVEYWPQLDDYIQYHNYLQHGSFAQLQECIGILGARPLAGVADYFVWGRLFPVMILGVAVVSLLYALTAVMLRRQLGRYFPVSPLFLVLFALLPLGVEGTYWMSASTRVVCGLFAAALGAGAFLRWMDTGRWGWGLAFLALQVLPMGFYEQSGVFAVTLVVGLAILEVIRSPKRLLRALLSLWSVPAMGLYFLVTRMLSVGELYASRSEILLPNNSQWHETLWPEISRQFQKVLVEGNLEILTKGFSRGISAVRSGELLLWGIAAAALCLLFGYVCFRGMSHGGEERKLLSPWLALLAGVLLFVAPLTIFLVLVNPWFSMRGAVTSFAGLALVCDTVLTTIWRRLPGYRGGSCGLAALLAMVFCVAGASEIGDYRATYEADQKVGQAVVEVLREDFPQPWANGYTQRIGIFNLLPTYLEEQNYYYHEHIHGCTESDWAFQGLLTCLGGEGTWDVTPLPCQPMYYHWNQATSRPETFEALYFYDGQTIRPVTLEQTGEHSYQVFVPNGNLLGTVWEDSAGTGYFQLK